MNLSSLVQQRWRFIKMANGHSEPVPGDYAWPSPSWREGDAWR